MNSLRTSILRRLTLFCLPVLLLALTCWSVARADLGETFPQMQTRYGVPTVHLAPQPSAKQSGSPGLPVEAAIWNLDDRSILALFALGTCVRVEFTARVNATPGSVRPNFTTAQVNEILEQSKGASAWGAPRPNPDGSLLMHLDKENLDHIVDQERDDHLALATIPWHKVGPASLGALQVFIVMKPFQDYCNHLDWSQRAAWQNLSFEFETGNKLEN